MTGRELIAYILENHLESEKISLDTVKFLDYISKEKFAVKNKAGLATVDMWLMLGHVPFITIGGKVYVPDKTMDEIRKETHE